MATTHGKDGAVYVGANLAASITSWTATFDSGFADTVYLQDEYGAQIGGIKKLAGSLNCDTDYGDTNGQVAMQTAITGQTTARLYLCIVSGKYWEFNANMELVDTVDIGDVVKRVVSFRSNSTITVPT